MGRQKKIPLWEIIQFLIAILLLLAIVFFVFKISALLHEQQNRTPAEIESLAASFLYIIQAIFFLTTGILAFLSYLQAKETIFSPIKTEIFKLQINVLLEVLTFFHPTDELDFSDIFDFNRMVEINSRMMVKQYSEIHFGENNSLTKKINEEPGKSYIGIRPIPETGAYYPEEFTGEWKHYIHKFVYFTEKYLKNQEKLLRFTNSPLLPNDLKALIMDFVEAVTENLDQIGRTLTKFSQELPSSCTNIKQTSIFINDRQNIIKIWNMYNEERPDLDKKITAILDYINKYLHINQMIK